MLERERLTGLVPNPSVYYSVLDFILLWILSVTIWNGMIKQNWQKSLLLSLPCMPYFPGREPILPALSECILNCFHSQDWCKHLGCPRREMPGLPQNQEAVARGWQWLKKVFLTQASSMHAKGRCKCRAVPIPVLPGPQGRGVVDWPYCIPPSKECDGTPFKQLPTTIIPSQRLPIVAPRRKGLGMAKSTSSVRPS